MPSRPVYALPGVASVVEMPPPPAPELLWAIRLRSISRSPWLAMPPPVTVALLAVTATSVRSSSAAAATAIAPPVPSPMSRANAPALGANVSPTVPFPRVKVTPVAVSDPWRTSSTRTLSAPSMIVRRVSRPTMLTLSWSLVSSCAARA